jgi:hypothetical protein
MGPSIQQPNILKPSSALHCTGTQLNGKHFPQIVPNSVMVGQMVGPDGDANVNVPTTDEELLGVFYRAHLYFVGLNPKLYKNETEFNLVAL